MTSPVFNGLLNHEYWPVGSHAWSNSKHHRAWKPFHTIPICRHACSPQKLQCNFRRKAPPRSSKTPADGKSARSIAWQVLISLISDPRDTVDKRKEESFHFISTLFWKPRHHQDCKLSAFQRLKFSSHSIFVAFFCCWNKPFILEIWVRPGKFYSKRWFAVFFGLSILQRHWWAGHWRSNHPKTHPVMVSRTSDGLTGLKNHPVISMYEPFHHYRCCYDFHRFSQIFHVSVDFPIFKWFLWEFYHWVRLPEGNPS